VRIDRPDRDPDVSFEVVGQPKTAGSKTPRSHTKDGVTKMWVEDSSGTEGKAWRASIQYAAHEAMRGRPLLDGPLYVEITIRRPRGPGHFGQGRNRHLLLPSAPKYPATKPDSVKLARAVEDGLNAICWRDDGQNASVHVEKVYCEPGEPSGAEVRVWALPAQLGAAAREPSADQLALTG
jgi:Holliday junction resolvase RusA-like endonuclease